MSLVKKNKENSKTNLQKNERDNIDPQWNVQKYKRYYIAINFKQMQKQIID
jgi:hypothetical protein